ncbi:phage terminase large subunit [Tistrella sp. BH-R2-4]|uniref:Phage terminase large subunit n=1 Tax=Tistrella arctica TaxID=3133430 RepID=A0ABU9YD60_9PROT
MTGHEPPASAAGRFVFDDDLYRFIADCFGTVDPGARFLPNWHIDLIADHLEAVERGEITRLIINMPPRYMKSLTVSVAFPAWLLARDPTRRIIVASYALELARRHSLDTRQVMGSAWYRARYPGTRIMRGRDRALRFSTTANGFRFATSIGGSLTGDGGDLLIVDDPHDPRRAGSAALREAALTWFDQTLSTRLNDKRRGAIIVVMQRLHDRDLSGHLLDRGGWTHLRLTAEAERPERFVTQSLIIHRQPGEPLHAAREDRDDLARTRRDLGEAGYAAQYQQRPAPAAGGMVKAAWLPVAPWPTERRIRRVLQSWDTAYKADALNDPSVCLTVYEHDDGLHVADVWRARVEYPELRRQALALAERWRPTVVLIEDRASGQSLIQDLRGAGRRLPVVAVRPAADKLTRLAVTTPRLESGQVTLAAGAPWVADFVAELTIFPNTAHDDQVDALSQLLSWLDTERGRIAKLKLGGL